VFTNGTIDAEGKAFKPPERGEYREREYPEYDPLCTLLESPRSEDEVVDKVRYHQHGKVQCRKL